MSIAVPEPFAVSPMKREVLDLRNRFLRRALGGRRDTINEEYRCRVASAGCVQAISKEKWIRRIVSGGFNTSHHLFAERQHSQENKYKSRTRRK